jgi:hypothetical protein
MTGKGLKWGWAWLLALPLAANAQVDLTTLDRNMAGTRTQVLVLGSVHLGQGYKAFDAKALDPLLDRLAAYRPDIITVETLSGAECDLTMRHPTIYGADYCGSADAAKAATGLDVPAAIAETEATLKDWPAHPTPAQRRKLASRFLAANDRASAYVQWLQLPASERKAGDGLDDALVAMLAKIDTGMSETYQVGSKLAARLGLQRVYPADNHTGDNVLITDTEGFVKELRGAWAAGRTSDADALESREQVLAQAGDMLGVYRLINSPEYLRMRAESDVGAAMRAPSQQRYAQMYVGGWETRNLRMVANIRETFRERPGVRVLSIVGGTHKPWFDSWLGQLQGVEIVDVQQVLE